MRVLFITREGYNLSGARIRCYGFARELKKAGVEADVLSFADDLGAKYGEKEFQMANLEKLKLVRKAIQVLSKENKDTVFYIQRFNYHSFAPLWVNLIRKNRIIFDMDDWDMREDPRYYFGFYPSSKAEFITRKLAGRSFACIAASKYLFEYLSRFNKKVYYLPTGVDTDRFNGVVAKKPEGKIVLSWNGTVYHKEMFENVSFLLDCFNVLAEKFTGITLELAVEGRYLRNIRELAATMPYASRIIVGGWLDPEKMPDYLSTVDIGLLPLIQNTRFNLAKSPTKLFEYMAMAKPVVASNMGEAPQVIKDGANGLLAQSKQEFIAKLEALIRDSGLRQRLGAAARNTAQKDYSLSSIGKNLSEILQAP